MAFSAVFRDSIGMGNSLTRRTVIGGLAAGLALPALVTGARAAQPLDAAGDFGVTADILDDQSAKLQAALDAAHAEGRTLILPGGQIFAHDLELPGKLRIVGQPGLTMLISVLDAPVATTNVAIDLTIEGLGFSGGGHGVTGNRGLLELQSSLNVLISNCSFVLGRPTAPRSTIRR